MIANILHSFQILLSVFLIYTLVSNLEKRVPRFPWDLLIDKFGFRLYIPITSSIVLTILISIFLSMFGKPLP